MEFRASPSYPHAVRSFLQESVEERGSALAAVLESDDKYFGKRSNGKTNIECIMNSPDLTSMPNKDVDDPCNEHFMCQVEMLFRDLITAQTEIEKEKPYSSTAIEPSLAHLHVCDAWVIGGKLPDGDAQTPTLSMGDTLVSRLAARKKVRRVFSTSRTNQSDSQKHVHFACDLNTVSSADLSSQMREIDKFREEAGNHFPLIIYYLFGNTGGNCEINPKTGRSFNSANVDTTVKFLDAAKKVRWLQDSSVRFIVISSFHCSPERTGYNDRLQTLPSVDLYGCEGSESYTKAFDSAKASAGLLEYTSSKFASAAMFVQALTDNVSLKQTLKHQIIRVHELQCKLESSPYKDGKYADFCQWVLDTLGDDIRELDSYVDNFYEDTAGQAAHVCSSGIARRMQVVKIPFSLTQMIARRAPRVSLKTNCMCLKDSWIRTRGRLGWAITPDSGAAWMEAAAMRMDAECSAALPHRGKVFDVGSQVSVFSATKRCWLSAEIVKCGQDLVDVEFDFDGSWFRKTLPSDSKHLSIPGQEPVVVEFGVDETWCRKTVPVFPCS